MSPEHRPPAGFHPANIGTVDQHSANPQRHGKERLPHRANNKLGIGHLEKSGTR